MTVSVLLVDDHAVVREGYRRLLERRADISVIGEAGTAAEACERFIDDRPDVVVMDIGLPGASGFEAMRRMLAHRAGARVLMFSMHEEAVFARRALDAGARGYITKASAPEMLVEAVLAVGAGRRFLSHDVAQDLALLPADEPPSAAAQLSPREFEILRMLARGHTLASIAAQLGLTAKTVANHQSAIRQKLGAENAAQMLIAARRLGIAGG